MDKEEKFSMLRKINNFIKVIEESILIYGIILLSVLTVGNVISRKFFNRSWASADEISQFVLVMLTFGGIGYATRIARHIRMTAFFDMLSKKWGKLIMVIICIVTSVVLIYLAYYSVQFVLEAKLGERVTPALGAPFYLFIIIVPIGLLLGAVQYILALIKNLTNDDLWLSFEEKSEYKKLKF